MKKLVMLVCIIAILLCASSCNFDPYSGKRPYDYGNAEWTCEEISARFVVDEAREEYYYPEGEIEVGDTAYRLKLYFVHQTNQVIISAFDGVTDAKIAELYGECLFSENELCIEVDAERDTLFEGKHETITFVKK